MYSQTTQAVVTELSDIFAEYFEYVGQNESPQLYHRWAFITGVASVIGRGNYIPFGHGKIYANLYTILIGAAGTRKSTTVSQIVKLLRLAGYNNFAADRTSKEKFIADLQQINNKPLTTADTLEMDFEAVTKNPAEILIAADELQDFMGQSNLDFITMLGVLWDSKDKYANRTKNSKSNEVYEPYVSMLGGSTQTGFTAAFPPEIVTQGFLSRLLLIYGERTARRIAFPVAEQHNADNLVARLKAIRAIKNGAVTPDDTARKLAEAIYKVDYTLHDARFESYDQRRYTHMLKLALIMSQLRGATKLEEGDILVANTTLHYAEQRMTRALGEFGKSKYSDVAAMIVSTLQNVGLPMRLNDIWKHVANDLPSQRELADIIKSLLIQEKIKSVDTATGTVFIPNVKQVAFQGTEYLLDDFISDAELNYEI